MPTSATRSRLSDLALIDPQRDPRRAHAVVAGAAGAELPAAPRSVRTDVVGAGRCYGFEEWREETWSTSLLVVEGGEVVHEWYADGLDERTLFLGASMTKSVLAHLVGRAVREGALTLSDEVTQHVPELTGTGYDGTTVLDLVTMTTGVDWVEDYRDVDSLASRLLGSFVEAGDSRALLRAVRPGARPGTRFGYCTADSQVLDWVRERATGLGYADDVARLWQALGCVRDTCVATDGRGVALAGGGLAATARDWARVALLAIDGRTVGGEQLLDGDWVAAAARPAYSFLRVGRLPSAITTHVGFGYHWWPMDDAGRRVAADGSRGQFACVDRHTGAVVVKTSQWPYDDVLADRQARDLSYLGIHALLDAAAPHQPPTKEDAP